MPIYEYICRSCGFEKEHLQKMSDVPIAQCPECGSHEYVKLVSAAGFQLKGSGWYVTDLGISLLLNPKLKQNPIRVLGIILLPHLKKLQPRLLLPELQSSTIQLMFITRTRLNQF
ncbi:MAG: zinc ribbon domain-containing protein [Nitrosomonas sp.]|nr:MAG: zinc ribbon domain-containing protein [Nitrosomonas sp.]